MVIPPLWILHWKKSAGPPERRTGARMTRDATIADLAPDGRLFSSTRWCAWRSPISRRTNVRQATTHTSILHSGTPRTIVLERTQRLPAPVARRPIQCETMVKKRSDIRCAKARQLEVPIQRGPTECLLVFSPFPRPHVFPFRTHPAWECPPCSASNTAASPHTPAPPPDREPSSTCRSHSQHRGSRSVTSVHTRRNP